MEISWTDRMTNEEILHRVKEERNILQTIKRRKANWIGHILRRNCLVQHVIEGKIWGKDTSDGKVGEEDVSSYWMTLRKRQDTETVNTVLHCVENELRRGCGPVVRQTV